MADESKATTVPGEYELLRRVVEFMAVRKHPHGTLWDHVMRCVLAITEESPNPKVQYLTADFAFDCAVRILPYYEKATGDTYGGRKYLSALREHVITPNDETWAEVVEVLDEVEPKFLEYSPNNSYDHTRIGGARGNRAVLANVAASVLTELIANRPAWVAFHAEWAVWHGTTITQFDNDAWMRERLLQYCSGTHPEPLEVPAPKVPKPKAPRKPSAPKKTARRMPLY